MSTSETADLEAAIARAHRAMWHVQRLADAHGMWGLEEDCRNWLDVLRYAQEELLRGRRKNLIVPRQIEGQLGMDVKA